MPWPLHEHPASVVAIFTSFIPGFRLVDGEDLLTMGQLLFSARDSIRGGTSQSNAAPLETFISQVTQGGSVVLPPGLPGRYMMVMNDTASALQVYGIEVNVLTGEQDTIAPPGSTAQSSMLTQPAGSVAEYICFKEGMWKQFLSGDGTGPGGGAGIPEAPINGVTYGRLNGTWVPVLGLNGGTLTGPLILAPGPITNVNQAVSYNFTQGMNIDEGTY